MDIFARSEPRQFIFLNLDNEQNGQPTLETEEPMEVSQENSDDTEYLSTTSQIVKKANQSGVNPAETSMSGLATVGPQPN